MTLPNPTRYRDACGTHRGLLAHQVNGEPLCGQCRHGELLRCLEAERAAPPPRPVWLIPVTDEQAAERRAVLVAALDGWQDTGDAA